MIDIVSLFIDSILALSTIPLHELGHYYSARLMKVKAKLIMGKAQTWVYERTYFQDIVITLSGIIVGFIPIFYMSDMFYKYLIITGYVFGGCLGDEISLIKRLSYYLGFDIPDFIIKLDDISRTINHHKYCVCPACLRYKNDKMFSFRS